MRAISTTSRRELSSIPPLQGKAPKEIHAILNETLGWYAPSYATVKNWVAQFKRGDFSTCDTPRPGRPERVTTPEIIEQIHEFILEDRRISAKSIAEQLGISRERVGSVIHEYCVVCVCVCVCARALRRAEIYCSSSQLDVL